jgi:hypothetical protein
MSIETQYPQTAKDAELFRLAVHRNESEIEKQKRIIAHATSIMNGCNDTINRLTKQRTEYLQAKQESN